MIPVGTPILSLIWALQVFRRFAGFKVLAQLVHSRFYSKLIVKPRKQKKRTACQCGQSKTFEASENI